MEVMTTTISTCGCSSSTSTWRIVVVSIGGARDDREQVRDLRERLGRHAHRLVDLAAHERQPQVAARRRRSGSSRST